MARTCVHSVQHMATRHIYIPDADMPKLKRLERKLKQRRSNLSRWMVEMVLKTLAEMLNGGK